VAALGAAPQSLAEAFRDGKISVSGGSFAGYTIALLRVENLLRRDLTVDVNGRQHSGQVLLFREDQVDLKFDAPPHVPPAYLADGLSGALLTLDHAYTLRQLCSGGREWTLLRRLADARETVADQRSRRTASRPGIDH